MLPTGFIQELLSRVDVVEVVGRHVELKRAGTVHKGLCPFHTEKSPSFTVSPSRQTYHCFGCGAHGDAIKFLMENQGLPFMDAVRELAQRVGIAVPEGDASPEERARAAEQREKRQTLSEVLARAGDHYRAALKAAPRAIDYLKRRGLTGEIAARFGLGYAPAGWRNLASAFARYDDPLLVEAGLVIVQGEGDEEKRYDRFRDRIMFPIRSVRGEVIGFGGRVIDDGEPKYLNSPETPLFVKGRELYGLYEARSALREAGHALVVEGYMDVVALAQSGLGHAVATLGTACTAEHVAKLFRFTDHVVFSFDGDAAGRRAAGRALEASLPHASDLRTIRFLFLPAEHDPDSFVREHGAAAFEQQVAAALPLSRMLLQTAQEGCDLALAEGRARMLAQAKPLIELLPAGALREQLVGEVARSGGTSTEQLKVLWGSPSAPRRVAKPPMVASPTARRVALARNAATLLDRAVWLLLQRCELWQRIGGEDHERLAAQPTPYGSFFALLDRCMHDHGVLSRSGLLDWLRHASAEDGELAHLLDRSAALHDLDDGVDALADLRTVLLRLQLEQVNGERSLLVGSGHLAGDDLARFNELGKRQSELNAALAGGDTQSGPRPASRL